MFQLKQHVLCKVLHVFQDVVLSSSANKQIYTYPGMRQIRSCVGQLRKFEDLQPIYNPI